MRTFIDKSISSVVVCIGLVPAGWRSHCPCNRLIGIRKSSLHHSDFGFILVHSFLHNTFNALSLYWLVLDVSI